MPLLDSIPIHLSLSHVTKKFRLDKKPASINIKKLIETAKSLSAPKCLFQEMYISGKGNNKVKIENKTFSSRVLSINLENTQKVFPYIITIGKDLENKASACDDLLEQYYLDNLGDMILRSCRRYLENYIKKNFGIKKIAGMSPGSLEDWPITQQKKLFSLFENDAAASGVILTENMLMIPKKSVSGILFPTEISFSSCILCPRENCPARKAPYDENFFRKYGLKDKK